ncbi:fibril-forming collagen alpha chain-like [Motacilla alba alba]|uniref:fibril-forming collagen alpha chain-like n=1 Tax=Motacilla alba alba TaxID=1094192 RepID=UPI0018D556E7|nr:fibril-forming collagen alpha chain-like [Motacilla alba alba]
MEPPGRGSEDDSVSVDDSPGAASSATHSRPSPRGASPGSAGRWLPVDASAPSHVLIPALPEPRGQSVSGRGNGTEGSVLPSLVLGCANGQAHGGLLQGQPSLSPGLLRSSRAQLQVLEPLALGLAVTAIPLSRLPAGATGLCQLRGLNCAVPSARVLLGQCQRGKGNLRGPAVLRSPARKRRAAWQPQPPATVPRPGSASPSRNRGTRGVSGTPSPTAGASRALSDTSATLGQQRGWKGLPGRCGLRWGQRGRGQGCPTGTGLSAWHGIARLAVTPRARREGSSEHWPCRPLRWDPARSRHQGHQGHVPQPGRCQSCPERVACPQGRRELGPAVPGLLWQQGTRLCQHGVISWEAPWCDRRARRGGCGLRALLPSPPLPCPSVGRAGHAGSAEASAPFTEGQRVLEQGLGLHGHTTVPGDRARWALARRGVGTLVHRGIGESHGSGPGAPPGAWDQPQQGDGSTGIWGQRAEPNVLLGIPHSSLVLSLSGPRSHPPAPRTPQRRQPGRAPADTAQLGTPGAWGPLPRQLQGQ